ncbi:type IV secretion protein Rhs [Gibbsiella quercinecans]|uniref:type IV secretion protein Rhs n=1 Tax=Gibbsiella quercinecans TaxID=929813 RepID=UPI001E4D6962|nr:type IV secretion protein Rhs [Gibbsiella quercinecans]
MSDTEGSLRLLTPGEIALARTVFGSSITYPHVWIHHASYFPFKLQGRNTAMSPNGELYFRDWYCEDFSTKSFQYQHLFIHEMSHVWQYQRGVWVRMRGLVSGFISYEYSFENNKKLLDYRLEQQAQIIADYFLLRKFGLKLWLARRAEDREVSYVGPVDDQLNANYQKVLEGFPFK